MADFQFSDFEDYLEQLCREHVDVGHEVDGKVCFSRLRGRDEVTEIINNAGKNIVLLGRFNGRAFGDSQEAGMRQFAVIRFASFAELNNGDLTGGIDTAIDTAWNIMMQFIAKFRMDYKEDYCGPLGNVEFENMSWNEIDEPVYLENHYGWDLSIPFRSTQPGYDAGKWSESISTTIGGVEFTFKTLKKLIQFVVGAPGAPMSDGDTVYTNNEMINKRVLVIVDGVGLPVDDGSGDVDWTGSIDRHVEKEVPDNNLNFVGEVEDEEVVEIYIYT